MNIPELNGNGKSDKFRIGEYLLFLEESTERKRYYICPNCKEHKLSVRKDGVKYDCYSCHDTNKIAFCLRELAGEFSTKDSTIKELSQVNKSSQIRKPDETKDGIIKLADSVNINDFLVNDWHGNDLKYNVRSKEIVLNDEVVNLDTVTAKIAAEQRVHLSYELAARQILYLAHKNEFDPVKEMLESCFKQFFASDKSLNFFTSQQLCLVLFGTEEPLYVEYFYRWLIGSVARVYEPGCKMDEALVLQGRPDCYKSTFSKPSLEISSTTL